MLLEHVYPHHIEMIRANEEQGVVKLRQHLTNFTFPNMLSLQKEGGHVPDEAQARLQAIESLRSHQISAYLNFVIACCNQRKLSVIATDHPLLYKKKREKRIEDLNTHITALIQDIHADAIPHSSKMLVIVGAAHTNSRNSAVATQDLEGWMGYSIEGIVQKLEKEKVEGNEYRVDEMIFVSASSTQLHEKLASVKNRPVYLI